MSNKASFVGTCGKSWTRSPYQNVDICHVWTIERFSLRTSEDAMYSSTFSSPQGQDDQQSNNKKKKEWRIEFYPNGYNIKENEENKGYLSVFLELVPVTLEEPVAVSFSFSLHNEKGKCFKTSTKLDKTLGTSTKDTTTSINSWRSWGLPKFIKREELLLGSHNELPNDVLIITCKMSYFNECENIYGNTTQDELVQVPCDLSDNLGTLLTDKKLYDVTLSVGRKSFKAHRAILAARSRYFDAMFTNDMAEKKEDKVRIKDVKPEIFEEILTYIYTGKVEPINMSTAEKAKEILVGADFFALDRMKTMAENFLASKLTVENASEYLILSDTHSAKFLKARATDFVAENLKDVVETKGWDLMNQQHSNLTKEPILRALGAGNKRKRQDDDGEEQ